MEKIFRKIHLSIVINLKLSCAKKPEKGLDELLEIFVQF